MPMNRYPVLAILWLCLLVAQFVLSYVVLNRSRSKLFMAYCMIWTSFTTVRVVASSLKLWRWDWDVYWTGAVLMHCLAFAFILSYGIEVLRCNLHLPQTIFGTAVLYCAGLVFVIVITCWPDSRGGVIRFVEGGCITWICGAGWMAWSLTPGHGHIIARRYCLGNGMGESERLLVGFLIMYSGSVATGWLWAFVKAPQPAVWGVELAVQAAAVGWWLWNL